MPFLIISIIIFNFIAFFIPKNITRYEMFTTTLFALLLQALTDVFLDAKYHLYFYFTKEINWLALLAMFGIYPALNIIYLNYYIDKKTVFAKASYIFQWTIFSLLFEWLSVQSGYFVYNGWKLWYSGMCYPIIYILLAGVLKYTKGLVSQNK